jgi:hypothetical protein
MTWNWESISFLAAALFVTVYVTVKIVEARHVASVILEEAFRTSQPRARIDRPIETYVEPHTDIFVPIAWPEVEQDSRKSRHRARHEKEAGNNPYSASTICARVKSELAQRDNKDTPHISKETFNLMMADTDRLFHYS